LPQYLIKSSHAPERYFREQLSRLQTDHIDYYLMHMLSDVASWEKLVQLGIESWITEKKAAGQIRHIGFSYHGNTDMFLQILDAYPWDFCQIQYNYLDEHAQAGRRGLEEAARRGIPVIIMEPLRGGSLTEKLPKAAQQLFPKRTENAVNTKSAQNAKSTGRMDFAKNPTPASLALRWLWDQPAVTCVLSGMHSMDMVTENVAAACCSKEGCLTESERALIEAVKAVIRKNTLVSCTGCGYCQPCPAGVDIPGTFACYNTSASEGPGTARKEYMRNTLMRKTPTGAYRCIRCGRCVSRCPQQIPIPEKLQEARKVLETPLYHLAGKALRLFKLW
ncbi:MAG: aldo/keto reductase, partial [Firmicutes bacterium]|nr:aldo/keto reductase [Bacillota bacterium]